MDKWTRNCPDCGIAKTYTTSSAFNQAIRKNRRCKSCAFKGERNPFHGKKHNDDTKQKVGEANKHRVWTDKMKEKTRNSMSGKRNHFYGKQHTEETKKKLAEAGSGRLMSEENKEKMRQRFLTSANPSKNPDVKRKQRLGAIRYIESANGVCCPRYNKSSISIFNEINAVLGWNGIHAENSPTKRDYYIAELGYFVDYYEPNLNVVIEYDERYHEKQIERDMHRQELIEKFLGCKFYRIKENQDWREVLNEYRY